MNFKHLIFLLTFLGGCTHPPVAPCQDGRPGDPTEPCSNAGSGKSVVLNLVFTALISDELGRPAERSIAPGEVLHNGDQFSLYVEADQPAYIYVMQKITSGPKAGKVELLYPRLGKQRIEPGALRRIPQRGLFSLDWQPGGRAIREDIFVIARVEQVQASALSERTAILLKEYDRAYPWPSESSSDKFRPKVATVSRLVERDDGPKPLDRDKYLPGMKSINYTEMQMKFDEKLGATIIHFPFLHQGGGKKLR